MAINFMTAEVSIKMVMEPREQIRAQRAALAGIKKIETAEKQAYAHRNRLRSTFDKAQGRAIEDNKNRAIRALKATAAAAKRSATRVTRAWKQMGAASKRAFNLVKRSARIAFVAVGAAVIDSLRAFASFDDAMVQSLAIMGDVSSGLRMEMEKTAKELSINGVKSATELARSYFFLASAGLSAEQSLKALSVVEAFATAGAFDMALATDLITDAQSALGLTVKDSTENMVNMKKISDVLIGANTLANASTLQFSQSLMRAGPAMKAYNITLIEGVAVLAAYADQGLKGEAAGETFGRMLRLMIKGFNDNKAAWDGFGISIVDAEDNLRPMADIIDDLTNLLGDMGVTQKAATLEMLGFQARSQKAILPLLGMSDAIAGYNEELKEMGGITEEVRDKQMKSFGASLKNLWRKITDIRIAVGGHLAPEIEKLAEHFSKNREEIKAWAISVAGSIKDVTKWLIENRKWVLLAVAAFAGFAALSVVVAGFTAVKTVLMLVVPLIKAGVGAAGAFGFLGLAAAIIYTTIRVGQLVLKLFEYRDVQRKVNKHIKKQAELELKLTTRIKERTKAVRELTVALTASPLPGKLDDPSKDPFFRGVPKADPVQDSPANFTAEIDEQAVFENERQMMFAAQEEQRRLDTHQLRLDHFKESTEAEMETMNTLADARNDHRQEELAGWDALAERQETWGRRSANWGRNLGDVLTNSYDRAADSFANMLMKQKVDWKSFGAMFIKELLAMIIKLQIAVVLKAILGGPSLTGSGGDIPTSSFGGGTGPAALSTGFADGGHVLETGIAKVHKGEDIVPEGGGGLIVNVIDNAGVSVDIEENPDERTYNIVLTALASDGPMRRAVMQAAKG